MTPGQPIRALTGLRFFAALSVVLYHALRPLLVHAEHLALRSLANAPAAVTLFFVLSGFVLTHRYREEPLTFRGFMRTRVARLLPVYWLALLIALPIGAMARHKGVVEDPLGATSLLLVASGLQSWVPQAALRWNPPAWSLSCELFFSALFPLLLASFARLSARRILAVGIIAWCIGNLAPLLYLSLHVDPLITTDAPLISTIKFHPLARLPDFVIGIVAARLSPRVPTTVATVALVIAIAVVASGAVPTLVIHNALLAPAFAVAVLFLAQSHGVIARFLGSRVFVLLGDASYALYLIHVPLMMWCMAFLRVHELPTGAALVTALLAVPISVVVLILFERPLRRRLSRATVRGDFE